MTTIKSKNEKKTLVEISNSIQNKRNTELDTLEFPFDKIELAAYDIREDRDLDNMISALLRDGQLQVLTLSHNKGKFTLVNGRTRYLAMLNIMEDPDNSELFENVKVEVYEELTQLEQNYLNAQINVSQTPLTTNEKLAFTKKYCKTLDTSALGKALGLTKAQVNNYITVASQSSSVTQAFKPQKETGHGVGQTKVEELANVVKAITSVTKQEKVPAKTLKELGNLSSSLNMTRDVKRLYMPKLAKKTGELLSDPRVKAKYSDEEIVKIAHKETSFNNNRGGSGNKLPKNSSMKYKIIDELLKDNDYEIATVLYSEGLYREDENGSKLESETKRIIDKVDEIEIVGNEIQKLLEVEEYAVQEKKTLTYYQENVSQYCYQIGENYNKGLVYVNGASLFSQRPEFINFLRRMYPYSTIAFVLVDFYFHPNTSISKNKIHRELLSVYGGAKSINQLLDFYKDRIENIKIVPYNTMGQKKFIGIIEPKY